jgi:Putative MetA-pathway of phenol degradation
MFQQISKQVGAVVMAAGLQGVVAQDAELRPLSTDRPDTTESPFTVDHGRFQVEFELASMTRDGSGESYALGEMNLKYGLATHTDLQWVVSSYEHEAGGVEGFGDMQLRLKQNLWGNDGGETALAIMPFIQIPTGRSGVTSGEVEGGIILPFGIEGSNGWGYGVQAEVDLVADELSDGHHFEFLASATAAHDLTETLGCFFELVGIVGEGTEAGTEAYFNTGLTCAVAEQVQLDGGVRVGLTNDSDDFTPFVGISAKF